MTQTAHGLTDCVELIRSFYAPPVPFRGTQSSGLSDALERQKLLRLPDEFRLYLQHYAPVNHLKLRQVGDPIELLSCSRLGWRTPGYSYDPLIETEILSWKSHWFLFGLCGRDPLIIDCLDAEPHSPVYRAMYTPDLWSFRRVADSLGQFLLCACAMEHALSQICPADPIIDDDIGFRLDARAAQWLFPRIEAWAGAYYEEWLYVFDNA